MGNRRIVRPEFEAPPIKARLPLEFDKLQLLSIQEAGENLKYTDGKLGYKTTIQIPDITDFEWIRESTRLRRELTARFTAAGFPAQEISSMVTRELQINKPLGREQRTISSSTDDVANSDKISTKNKLIRIIQGRAESRDGQVAITAQLVQIFQDTTALNTMSNLQLRGLGQALARIGVPTNYKRLGIIPRYVDNAFYLANAGIINLLLFSKVREQPNTNQYNYDLIVKNFTANANGLPAVKLSTMVSSLRRLSNAGMPAGDRFLDLERGGVISLAQLRALGINLVGNADVEVLAGLT